MAQLTREYIKEMAESWDQHDSCKLDFTDAGVKIRVKNGDKAVDLENLYEMGEFHLNFKKGSECIFYDWFEVLDDDPSSFRQYVTEVINSYLLHSVRVAKKGFWPFRVSQLQYFNGRKWVNVMGAST